jgi:nucleotide-binding universal stress UspA family protein
MPNRYVVAYDDSQAARRAVDFAVERAKQDGATLIVAHVLEWSPYSFLSAQELEERHKRREQELTRARSAIVDPLLKELDAAGVTAEPEIRYGHVVETIVAIAEDKKAAQIFIGRTGQTGMVSRLFGSVAGSLSQVAPVPCTIVP